MKWSQVKTIMVFVLLGVNLMFLLNLWRLHYEAARAENQAILDSIAILERENIILPREIIPAAPRLNAYFIERDLDSEEALAAKFLDEYAIDRPGGGITVYRSQNGEALFRNGGYLEISVASWPENMRDLPDLTEKVNALIHEIGAQGGFQSVGTAERTVVRQTMDGYHVFNGEIRVDFTSRPGLSGRWILNSCVQYNNKLKKNSELILSLLPAFSDLQDESALIQEIEEGYLAVTGRQGSILLAPVWKIAASAGICYIDLSSGELINAD